MHATETIEVSVTTLVGEAGQRQHYLIIAQDPDGGFFLTSHGRHGSETEHFDTLHEAIRARDSLYTFYWDAGYEAD